MIKIIIENYHSKMDVNGNRYWATLITNVRTGRRLHVTTAHSSNVAGAARDLYMWDEIHETMICEVPYRDFKSMTKDLDYLDGDKLTQAIKKLNRKESSK